MTTISSGEGGSQVTPPERGTSVPEGLIAIVAVVGVLALTFALAVLVIGDRNAERAGTEGTGPVETVAVELGDLFVKPDSIEVPSGSRLEVEVTNAGDLVHTLNLEGAEGTGTERLKPGESQTADFGVIDADTQAWCLVPGHKEAGMLMEIKATEATAGPETAPSSTGPSGGG